MVNLQKWMLAVAMASSMCLSVQADNSTKGVNLADLDTSVAPGADFYDYACGGWMKANPIKGEYSRFGTFDVLGENNKEQLKELFATLLNQRHENGTVGQKVSDLYKMAMDSDRLNREGATPFLPELQKIKSLDRKQLTAYLAYMHLNLSNAFFSTGVMADLAKSDMNTLYISSPSLGMPDRDYYLKTDAETKKIQQGYLTYLEKIFTLAGYSNKEAKRIAKTVMKIETQFADAKLSRTESRDYSKLYNVRTVADMKETYPNVNWDLYFSMSSLPNVTTLILTEPKVMAVANDLMASLKDQELKDYLLAMALESNSSVLGDSYRNASFDFYGRILQGRKEMQPRWKSAQSMTQGLLGEAVGQLYVDKYFAKGSKEKMVKLVNNLRTSLGEHIANLSWMSDSTKINALVKLNSLGVKIGYPDKWRDYTDITIDPAKSLSENMMAASQVETLRNLKDYGQPVDKEKWGMTPQTINAYYSPLNNEICFPAAILQPPFFDPEADDAVNYGAIGVVIGHEMTHGFDDQGRNFNQNGNMQNWWAESDVKNFNELTDKLANQFDQIVVVGDIHANGKLTLGENIADQGGLRVSYSAFKKTQEGNSTEKINGFTPDQRFYLAYARVWASNIRDAEIQRLTKVDVHSLGRWRVDQTLRNIEPFYKAFNIKEGDAMYLAPSERVVIW